MSREELGKAILECLKDVASLLERAQTVALEEQEALVRSDAEAVAVSCRAQEEVLRRITEADQRAAAVAEQLVELAGLDADSADADAVAEAAGYPYAGLIRHEIGRISALAREVERANAVNGKLLENGLEIVTTCLRTLASGDRPAAYSKDASLADPHSSVLSLDKRA